MERIGIIYFSGTGNTKFIANKMEQALQEKNVTVHLINIEKDDVQVDKYDRLIVGGPVYVERYPEILVKYLEKNIKDFKGKCMMFSTQASDGKNPTFVQAMAHVKNLNVTYHDYIAMPNNFYNFGFKKNTDEEIKELVESAEIKAKRIALEFLEDKENLFNVSKAFTAVVRVSYHIYYPLIATSLMNKLKLDKDKCIKCNICVKNCPTKALSIEPKVKVTKDCAFCQRCINNCPKNAFIRKGKPIQQYKPNLKIKV